MKPENTSDSHDSFFEEDSSVALRYKTLLNTSSDGILILNDQGNVVEANAAFCNILGYSGEELAKLNVADWGSQWMKGELFAKLGESISHPLLFDARLLRKDGTLIDVEMNGVGMLIDNKKFFYAAARDITLRKQAELAVHISETRYRRLFESAQDGILILDAASGMITDVNPFLIELLGYSKEQFLEKEIWNIGFLQDIPVNHDKFLELQQRQYVRYDDLPLRTAAGKKVNVEFISNVYLEGAKKVIQCNIRSIAKRKEDEAAKQEALNRLNKIAGQVPGVIYQYRLRPDGSACFPYASEAINDIYRLSPQEVETDSSKVTEIIHPDDLAGVIATIQHSAENLTPWQHEYRVKFAENDIRFLYGDALPQLEPDGSVLWHGFITDITRQKQLEDQRREAKDRLKTIARLLPGVIYQFRFNADGSSSFPYASDAIQDIFEVSANEVKEDGAPVFSKIHPQDYQKVLASIKVSGERMEPWELEYRMQLSGGREKIIYGNSIPEQQPDGSILWSGFATDITKRKKEDKLKYQAVDRLEKIASQLPGVIFQFRLRSDGSYGFPYASEAVKEFVGADYKETMKEASKAFNMLHPDDFDRIFNSIYDSAKKMALWQQEFRIIMPDGFIRTMYGNAMPQSEADGSTLWHGFITDITKRKKAELQQQEIQDRLKKISKMVPGVIYQFRLKPDGSCSLPYISDLFYKLYSDNAEKLIADASGLLARIHPDDYDAFMASIAISAKDLSAWQHEFRIKLDDGRVLSVSGSSIPQREDDGSIVWSGLVTDITELNRTKEKINQLSQAMEQSPVSIVITDTTGAIQYVNQKFTETTGYSFDEAINQNPRILKSGHTTPEEYEQLWKTLLAGEVWHGEFYNKKKNGEYYWESATISPILNTKGVTTHWLSVEEDITERKKAAITLQEYATELKSSNDDLVNFAFIASHDLQEPLRMVSSFLKLLEQKLHGQLNETTQKYIDFAADGANRMKTLINDLLQYSRVGTNVEAFSKTDLNEMLLYIRRLLSETIEKNNAIIRVKPLPVVNANKVLMNELWLNLVSNALKYRGLKDPEIEVGYTEDNDRFIFYVKDNGIGIEEEYFSKIFVIFQRLHGKEDYSGTGIGLALCKKIVETHHGKIWVESEPGTGSTFYFAIPK